MSKHLLAAIFERRANIAWTDIEAMHYGAEISEGSGSRVRIALNGVRAVSCSIGRILKKRQIEVRLLPCRDFSLRMALELRGNHDLQGISIKSRVG